jgi:hypothetical protein
MRKLFAVWAPSPSMQALLNVMYLGNIEVVGEGEFYGTGFLWNKEFGPGCFVMCAKDETLEFDWLENFLRVDAPKAVLVRAPCS